MKEQKEMESYETQTNICSMKSKFSRKGCQNIEANRQQTFYPEIVQKKHFYSRE